ncbi:MAG: DUF4129 domain-containing protein [Rhodothermales bacterium]
MPIGYGSVHIRTALRGTTLCGAIPRGAILRGAVLRGAVLLVVLAGIHPAVAQPVGAQPSLRIDSSAVEARPVPTEALDRFRADPDFAYERTPPSPSVWGLVWRWIERHIIAPFYAATSESARSVLFYGLLAVVLLFALYRLFGADRQGVFGRKGQAATLDGVLAERGIEAVDLAALTDAAAREGRFREAMRLLYLRTLQLLSEHGRIRWTLDKTNRDYAAELRGTDLEGPFAAATRLFERAWYGSLPVDAGGFEDARSHFLRFHDALGPTEARR